MVTKFTVVWVWKYPKVVVFDHLPIVDGIYSALVTVMLELG